MGLPLTVHVVRLRVCRRLGSVRRHAHLKFLPRWDAVVANMSRAQERFQEIRSDYVSDLF